MSVILSEKHAAIFGVLDRLARIGRRILEEENFQQVTTTCDDQVVLKLISTADERWGNTQWPIRASQDVNSERIGDAAN